jgi:hypothetical protein
VDDSRLGVQGPESWHDGDRTYEIAATYYRRGIGNAIWYVVVPKEIRGTVRPIENKNRALPLIRYVYEHRLHERGKILPVRGSIQPLIGISVEFVSTGSGKVIGSYDVPGGEVSWRLAHPDDL